MKAKFIRTAVAIGLGTLAMGALSAQAATLPAVQKSGTVAYLSGGISHDESTAIRKAAPKWPLTLEFAAQDQHHADYLADVKFVVRDAKGHTLLQSVSDGPFVLARLSPGRYDVDATFDGKTLHREVTVKSAQSAKALFLWPATVDNSLS